MCSEGRRTPQARSAPRQGLPGRPLSPAQEPRRPSVLLLRTSWGREQGWAWPSQSESVHLSGVLSALGLSHTSRGLGRGRGECPS